MKLGKISAIFVILALIFSQSSTAQVRESGGSGIKEGIGRTWKGPNTSILSGILLKKRTPAKQVPKNSRLKTSPAAVSDSVKFKPAVDSGVALMLADAFSSNPAEKSGLLVVFAQIKQGYETEIAKEGKSNDLAAAMTFFIAANVTAYHQSEEPSDRIVEDLYESLRGSLAATPEFVKTSNAEKQQMHDWMVYMAGFVMAGYMDAKQNGDTAGLATFKDIADASVRLVLGIEGSKLKFGENGLISG